MTESESNSEELTEEEYTYHTDEDQSLSEAVIWAVSAFTGRETITANANGTQEALEPLFDTIDPDALDSLFQTAEDRESMVGTVEFWYCGCEVTVDSTGFVIVTKR
ncbi:HalOD1 output domain-containing protein [Haloarcula amylovorans]|uniref:HalOD1 output domain-containing protein n=1 Tax=Haloarcula amylovorans TaxID=2562280 RepID=UPI0010766D1A|nr:HalOD1 output domain-containing protein [Halomicroarcula amylolytica]